jgi:hypothetical protein
MNSVLRARGGYALVLTMLFIVLFLCLLGVAWRQTASALRVDSVRAIQAQRDQGEIPAVARALGLMESGSPPSSPYVCGVTINTPSGLRQFTVTFTAEGTGGTRYLWSIQAAPTAAGQNPPPMPGTFVTSP